MQNTAGQLNNEAGQEVLAEVIPLQGLDVPSFYQRNTGALPRIGQRSSDLNRRGTQTAMVSSDASRTSSPAANRHTPPHSHPRRLLHMACASPWRRPIFRHALVLAVGCESTVSCVVRPRSSSGCDLFAVGFFAHPKIDFLLKNWPALPIKAHEAVQEKHFRGASGRQGIRRNGQPPHEVRSGTTDQP